LNYEDATYTLKTQDIHLQNRSQERNPVHAAIRLFVDSFSRANWPKNVEKQERRRNLFATNNNNIKLEKHDIKVSSWKVVGIAQNLNGYLIGSTAYSVRKTVNRRAGNL